MLFAIANNNPVSDILLSAYQMIYFVAINKCFFPKIIALIIYLKGSRNNKCKAQ